MPIKKRRRNLEAFVRAELALELKPLVAAQARERQREHGGTAPGKTLFLESEKVNPKTREELAKIARTPYNRFYFRQYDYTQNGIHA